MSHGDLSRTAAADVLEDLAARAQSGLLVLKRGQVACNLCLQDGRLVYATSNLKKFQPAVWLAARGLATQEAADMASAGPRPGTQGLVETLVESGAGERAPLVDGIRALVRSVVLDALAWRQGTYSFAPGVPVLGDEILLAEPTKQLLGAAQAHGAEHAAAGTGSMPPQDEDTGDRSGDTGPGPEAPTAEAHPEVAAFRDQVRAAEGLDFYGLLGLERGAGAEQVRQNYYRMARRYHPDALRGVVGATCRDEGERYFAMVTEAYNTLTREDQRAEYDEQLKVGHRGRETTDAQDTAMLARQNFEQGRRSLVAGELYDATQFFSNAVRLDPSRGEYHRELGVVQMQNPRWQKLAEESLVQALEMQPADVRALVHLGKLYQRNGLKKRARDTYEKALKWDPDCVEAQQGLATLTDTTGPDEGGLLKGLFSRR